MAVQRTGENVNEGLGRVAPQGRRRVRHRLRVPSDHRRRRRRVAEVDQVPHRARGRHQLQAVHGLSRRLLQRRRPDPARDADRVRVRRDDHDARRERHRDRRAGGSGAGPRRDRPEVPLLHAALAPGGRGDAPRHRAVAGGGQRAALHRSHVGGRRAGGGRRRASRRAQRVRRDLPAVPVADPGGHAWPSRDSRAPSGCARHRCDPRTAIATTRPTCGGAADERAGRRQHRPLPLLLQGSEGAGPGRLLEDPQRHRRRRAPHGADLPGRRGRRAVAGALGRDVLHHAGAHVRHVSEEGDRRAGRRRRHRGLGPQHEDQDRHQRQAPHEHGLLGLRGLRRRRQGRHGALARGRWSSRTTRTRGERGTAGSSSAVCRNTSSEATWPKR